MSEHTINGKKRFLWSAGAAGLLVAGALFYPTPARAQFGLSFAAIMAMLKSVESVMSTTITPTLSTINQTESHIKAYQQTVMYPESEIARFQALAPEMLGEMNSMHSMFSSPLNSATLAAPHAFESTILSANPNTVSSVNSGYSSVYGALPPSTEITPQLRTVVDMNDADAEDGLKLAVKLDAIANTEETLAQQYMKQLGSSAPGNAALIEAQAGAMSLEADAYTQQAFDEMLRLQASEAAYQGFRTKREAVAHQGALDTVVNPAN